MVSETDQSADFQLKVAKLRYSMEKSSVKASDIDFKFIKSISELKLTLKKINSTLKFNSSLYTPTEKESLLLAKDVVKERIAAKILERKKNLVAETLLEITKYVKT